MLLQSKGVVQRTTEQGLSPLLYASINGNTDCVRLLVENAKDPKQLLDLADSTGFTPLMGAARNGHVHTIHLLLSLGVSINSQDANGMTALHWAVANNNLAAVGVICEYGANVNLTNKQKQTPLLVAVVRNYTDIAFTLIQSGAQVCDAVRLTLLLEHIKSNNASKVNAPHIAAHGRKQEATKVSS